jgi:hypothetical protein
MRIILRTCIILVAALAVCGGTWALVRSSGANAGFPQRSEFAQRQGRFGAFNPQGNGQFRPREGEREGRGGGLFAVLEVGRPLVIIAVIVTVFSLVARMFRRTPAARAQTAQSPPGPTPSV